MPPQPLIDLSAIDTSRVLVSRDEIYRVNPHRFEFQLLDGIYLLDRQAGAIAGFRDVKSDEFWVRGHIPGRPIFPGVLMIETAAQMVSYYAASDPALRTDRFLGFGAVDGVKFREAVVPGDRVLMIGKMVEVRPGRRCIGDTQAYVNDKLVYEGRITGMWL